MPAAGFSLTVEFFIYEAGVGEDVERDAADTRIPDREVIAISMLGRVRAFAVSRHDGGNCKPIEEASGWIKAQAEL